MPDDDVLTRVLDLVNGLLRPSIGGLRAEDSLPKSGLDSIAMVQLLALVEESFSVTLRPADLTPEHFATPRSLAGLVRRLGER